MNRHYIKLKIALLILFALIVAPGFSQNNISPKEAIAVFPYQHTSEADKALSLMKNWKKSDWKSFFNLIEDTGTKIQSSFALHAFVNIIALDPVNKDKFIVILTSQMKKAKSEYAKILLQEELKLLSNSEMVDDRLSRLPNIIEASESAFSKLNGVQKLLVLQNLEATKFKKSADQIKQYLFYAGKIKGYPSFMFVAKYLKEEDINKDAAIVIAKMALNDESIKGDEVRNVLEAALPLIHGEDSAVLVTALKAHLKKMPYDYGFVSLFNGKDLTGWKGLVANPIARSKMSETELQAAQVIADKKMREDWIVKDGLLNFTGNEHGENLATIKQYGDMEMFIDWRIQPKGDAGIYLRGTPQVQIWDTSRREVGAQVGSGGLYNNQKNVSKPLVVADHNVGEWNNFHIIMYFMICF